MRSILVLLFCLVAVAPVRGQDPGPDLEAGLRRLVDDATLPGLSVAVVRDGRVAWTGAFGTRDADTGAPVTDQTVFQAASLSKPVFAYIVLRLAERDVIDLDRPLHEYRPNPRLPLDDRSRRITARMVLTHSTGLPNWGGDTLALAFEPGTRFSYSGEGYVYLQRVVEERTRLGLDELARREVFEPLGMGRTAYVWHDRFDDDAAAPHDVLDRPLPLPRRDEANAAASLLTSAADYATFVRAVLAGEGLAPESRTVMLSPGIAAPALQWTDTREPRMHWGLGWGLVRAAPDEPESFWHWGDNGPYKAYVVAYPRRGDAVVYFANSQRGLAVAEALTRLALGPAHLGARWAGHDQYDDPPVIARRDLYRAFIDSAGPGEGSGDGPGTGNGSNDAIAAGLRHFDRLHSRNPDLADADLVRDVADLLGMADRPDAAVALLERARATIDDPDAGLGEPLAMAYFRAGRLHDAAGAFTALAGEAGSPEGRKRLERSARWIEPLLEAREIPVRIPARELRGVTGRYGPRSITLDDGILYYQREGNPRHRLKPLGDDTFQPVGLETFRIRFDRGPEGRPTAIIGLYMDGSTDRSERSG
jgi:CubicO group peptidase (beta-lactamase class C family)